MHWTGASEEDLDAWVLALAEIEAVDRSGETLGRVAATTLLADGGLAIAEGHWRDDPGQVPGLERVRESRYGETAVWIYATAVKKEEGV